MKDELGALPISELPDKVRRAAYAVSNYLDNLGVMTAEGLLAVDVAAARFLGDTALALWRKLQPCIENERHRRARWPGGRDYERYFEDLAERLREVDLMQARKEMKRWRG